MYLDQIDSFNLSVRGVWEPFGTEVFKKQIKEGDIVLDIGAGIGYFTLIAARSVGNTGKVYAFEPEPTNYSIVEKNIQLNRYHNVILIQMAVSNKNGKCKFYLDKKDLGKHSLFGNGKDFIEIRTTRLDDYFKDEKIDFIKMDIQGAEWLALKGMVSILKRNKNIKIYTELDPASLRKSDTEPQKYMKMLMDFGFNLYEINERTQKLELLEKIPDKIYGAGINLLCLR